MQACKSLLFADKTRDIKHLRPFALTDQSQTECVHYLAHSISFFLNPFVYGCILCLYREIIEAIKKVGKLAHFLGRILFPTFFYGFLVILLRSNEIEIRCIPKFVHKIHTSFHQGNNFFQILQCCIYSMRLYYRHEHFGYLTIGLLQHIFMIEP